MLCAGRAAQRFQCVVRSLLIGDPVGRDLFAFLADVLSGEFSLGVSVAAYDPMPGIPTCLPAEIRLRC